LIIESVGLDQVLIDDILDGHWPALRHLECWIGDDQYTDVDPEQLPRFLDPVRFPPIDHLAFCNAHCTDAIVAALARTDLAAGRIKCLDLSLGTLSNKGAQTILNWPAAWDLERLDLAHNYISDPALIDQLCLLALEVDLGPPEDWPPLDEFHEEGPDDRYVAICE